MMSISLKDSAVTTQSRTIIKSLKTKTLLTLNKKYSKSCISNKIGLSKFNN